MIASLLSRERGLKFGIEVIVNLMIIVAPLAGAWIEIEWSTRQHLQYGSRSSRGSVD